jgi:hypothetical protein
MSKKQNAKAKDTAAPKTATKKKVGAKPSAHAASGAPKRVSALSAAVRVLEESGKAMNCNEMIQTMAARGYWKSPGGKTPAATLYSAILRELKSEGNKSRFKKTARGQFTRT